MNMAGADIAHAAIKTLGAEPLLRFRLVHEADMRIAVALRGDFGVLTKVAFIARLVRDVELAGHIIDLDLMLTGKIEEMALGRPGKIEQRLRPLVADLLLELFRPPSLA